jgi:hypothetical protein
MARRRDDDDDDDDDDRVSAGRSKRRSRDDDDDDDDDDDRPRGKKGKKRGGSKGGDGVPIGDYLFFRKIVGPPLVMVIFLLGVVLCIYMSIYNITYLFPATVSFEGGKMDFAAMAAAQQAMAAAARAPSKFDATMIWRGFCEGLACLMRIADSMDALKKPAEADKKDEPPPEKKAEAKKPADDDDDDED